MKTRLYNLVILLTIVLAAITNVDARQSETATSQNAFDFYNAFNAYKAGNNKEAIASMVSMGFVLDRSVQTKLKPNGTIDSLIFSINESTKAVFQTLNLDYLKNVDVTFRVKSKDGARFVNELTSLLKNDGLRIDPDMFLEGCFSIFEDKGSYTIVDSRWDEWTTSQVSSLYNHSISNYKTFFVAKLTEVVPQMIALDDLLFAGNNKVSEEISAKTDL